MATVQVRYIVHDVEAAIPFYTQRLGFTLEMHPAPAFAMLTRGDLRLVLSAPNPNAGGGQSMPDGTRPEPGGWNRFAVEVDDIAAAVDALREAGARFRSDIIAGVGGRQVIVEDPSGNPVELFEPTLPEARLRGRHGPPHAEDRRKRSPALLVFHLVLGLALLWGSVHTVLHLGATDVHARVIGAVEAVGAAAFLVPRTLQLGAALLLVTILLAVVLHAARGEGRPDLLVYAAGVLLVAAHRRASRLKPSSPESDPPGERRGT